MVQGGDAADFGAVERAVAFDKRVVCFVVDGDVLADGYAGAKLATDVPVPRRLFTPSGKDGVQSSRCCFTPNHNGSVLSVLNQTN